MKCTFNSYVNSSDRNEQRLLADEQLSLAEIAGVVGYEDQSYLTKCLRKLRCLRENIASQRQVVQNT